MSIPEPKTSRINPDFYILQLQQILLVPGKPRTSKTIQAKPRSKAAKFESLSRAKRIENQKSQRYSRKRKSENQLNNSTCTSQCGLSSSLLSSNLAHLGGQSWSGIMEDGSYCADANKTLTPTRKYCFKSFSCHNYESYLGSPRACGLSFDVGFSRQSLEAEFHLSCDRVANRNISIDGPVREYDATSLDLIFCEV